MTHYVTFCSHVCKQFEHSVLHLHSNSTIRKHASFHWCAHSFNQDKYGWKDTLQKIIYVWTWKRNRSVKKTTQLNSVLLSSWDFQLPPCNFFNIGQNFRSLQFKMWFTKKLKLKGLHYYGCKQKCVQKKMVCECNVWTIKDVKTIRNSTYELECWQHLLTILSNQYSSTDSIICLHRSIFSCFSREPLKILDSKQIKPILTIAFCGVRQIREVIKCLIISSLSY